MVEKKQIKEIGRYSSYENAWPIVFTDGSEEQLSGRVQKTLKAQEPKEQLVEFLCDSFLLSKDDILKLQALR